MEGSRRSRKVAALLVVVMVVVGGLAGEGEAAISCGTVRSQLAPCVAFATSGGKPSASCCSGVQSLYNSVKGLKSDRVTACGCIKSLIAALGSAVKSSNVAALPGLCNINLGYSISTSTNCATIP